ncbi:MAG: nucleoside kinase [Lachnospirales bacterium]
MKYYNVVIANNKEEIVVDENTTVYELSKNFRNILKGKILNAKINGELKSLDCKINKDCTIEFFDITSRTGYRTYQRSCFFMMLAAANEVLGNNTVIWAEHTVNDNYFCCCYERDITEKDLLDIKNKMEEMVDESYRIEKISVSIDDSVRIFKKYGLNSRINSLKFLNRSEISLYKLNDFYDYLYGPMVPDTSYIKVFDIKKCANGFVLQFESSEKIGQINDKPVHPKLMQIFREHNDWSRILNIDTVYALNNSIVNNTFKENIWVAEALHEKKIAEIADMIHKNQKRIVMIAGPSSSGKTTFSKRLSIQLRALGLNPSVISLDDYYKNRADILLEEDGSPNFEKLSAIDVEKFNVDMTDLLAGKAVGTPLYDFHTGKRKAETKVITLGKDDVLVIEGIHGINEALSYSIPKEDKFKIYICALTQLNIDEHNRISTSDLRLIRRIVRDNLFRGFSVKNTMSMWPKVLAGEEENIYPFQEEADVMFNSSLIYELSILKSHCEPLLYEIEKGDSLYSEARRLLSILSCFIPVDSTLIPTNSLIREFIGGSCFS